ALSRRLQLALSLRLGDRGDSGREPIPAETINGLIAMINQAAAHYPQQLALAESLAVRDRIVTVKREEGETPILEKALTAQTEFIGSLVNPSAAPTAEAGARPHLQMARRPSHVNEADIEALQTRTLQWFDDYHARLEELAEIARSAEVVTA